MKKLCPILLLFIAWTASAQTVKWDTLIPIKIPPIPKKNPTSLPSTLSTNDYQYNFLPTYSPLSPNAAAFQKFGDYSVNFATGIPDISIPIHTISVGGLTMPIVLRYHSGGFRMDDMASWVGWGWSLDLGASLNRKMQGLPDEQSTGYLSSYSTIQSRDLCNNSTDYYYALDITNRQRDAEPDLFSYNLPSKSGKFFIKQNNQGVWLMPFQPVNVSYTSGLGKLSILDESGKEYDFGQQADGNSATETQTVIQGSNNSFYSSSFEITQVKEPNSDNVINYYYQNGGAQYLYDYQWSASIYYNLVFGGTSHYTPTYFCIPTYRTVSTYISQKNIQTITFKNGEIDFIQSNPSTEPRTDATQSSYLKQINIYNYENGVKTLIKQIKFTYDYFQNSLGNNARLKLNKVSFQDANNTIAEDYNFDYWTNNFSWWDDISSKKAQDYFGFYNGKTANQHLIGVGSYNTGDPTIGTVQFYGGAADRSTVSTYMKECVLKRITYPTKGYTEFDYEPNQYIYNSTPYLAGGLRVKQINSVSGVGNTFKRYEYSSNDGIGYGKFTTNWTPQSANNANLVTHVYDPNPELIDHVNTATEAVFLQDGFLDKGGFDQASVYYTNVKEYFEASGTTPTNGYNAYTFTFRPDFIFRGAYNYQGIKDIKFWLRGQLLTKSTYDNANNFIASTSNTYSEMKQNSQSLMAYVLQPTIYDKFTRTSIPCPTTFINANIYGNAEIYYNTYINYTGSNQLVNSVITQDGISTTNAYVYDNNLLLTQKQSTDSQTSSTKIETMVYPTDNSYSSDNTAQQMVTRNMIGVELEKRLSESISGNNNVLFNRKNVFQLVSATNNAQGYTTNIVPYQTWVAPAGGTLEKRVEFTDYDIYGNPLSYTADTKPITLVWGYNNSLLLGQIENATNAQVQGALGALGINASTYSVSNFSTGQLTQLQYFRNSFPQSTWFTYRPHIGVSSTLSAKGILTSFVYDGLNRLRDGKDHDGNLTDLYQYNYATVGLSSGSNLVWDNTRRTKTCNSSSSGITMTVYVTGINAGAGVQFSTDGTNWNNANVGADGYQYSLSPTNNYQTFYARASDNLSNVVSTQYHASCSGDINWQAPTTSVNGDGTITLTAYVNVSVMSIDAYAEFSTDGGTTWQRANLGTGGFQITVPCGSTGSAQAFQARYSDRLDRVIGGYIGTSCN